MSEPSSTLIAKIQKLRALASSANVHEAAAAAAAAERLIQEHNLSEAEVATGAGDEDEPVEASEIAGTMKQLETWKGELFHFLLKAYQCSGYWQRSRRYDNIEGGIVM